MIETLLERIAVALETIAAAKSGTAAVPQTPAPAPAVVETKAETKPVVAPVVESAKPETKPEPETAKKVTVEDLRKLGGELVTKGKKEAMKDVFRKFGATTPKLPEIKEADYAAVHAELKTLLA